jgi:lipopolysaccharide export system permease protein
MSFTLYRYIGLKVLTGVLALLLILTGLTLLIDLIESLRQVGKIENAGLMFALKLTVLRTPKLILTLMPFIFLFGTMWAFFQLNRRSEIAVMRSAGLSVWKIAMPAMILAIVSGVIIPTLIDPIASNMSALAQHEKNAIRGKKAQLLKELQGDIWLRQREGDVALILHAEGYDPEQNLLSDVTLWKRTLEGVFLERWDAQTAVIADKQFILQDAQLNTADNQNTDIRQTQIVPSAFNLSDLRESIARPDQMSIWALPGFIQLAHDAGLPTVKYHLRLNDLLSTPLKLLAMILIAAGFSMQPVRSGGTASLILSGIAAGFLLFIIAELSNATAEAQVVPVFLAAWAPAMLATLLALTLLLHTEDG